MKYVLKRQIDSHRSYLTPGYIWSTDIKNAMKFQSIKDLLYCIQTYSINHPREICLIDNKLHYAIERTEIVQALQITGTIE